MPTCAFSTHGPFRLGFLEGGPQKGREQYTLLGSYIQVASWIQSPCNHFEVSRHLFPLRVSHRGPGSGGFWNAAMLGAQNI